MHEDVEADFFPSGGYFASLFCSNEDGSTNFESVFQAKRITLHFNASFMYVMLYVTAKRGGDYLANERNAVIHRMLGVMKYILDSGSTMQYT